MREPAVMIKVVPYPDDGVVVTAGVNVEFWFPTGLKQLNRGPTYNRCCTFFLLPEK